MYKFSNHRKEIKKLKTHEKDFLFQNMSLLRGENDEKSFDLATIEEASEYYFYNLILTYSENLNFDKPTRNYLNQIIDKQSKENDEAYFNNYYGQWVNQLETKKGKYLNFIHTELHRRLKKLQLYYEDGKIKVSNYDYQIKYLHTIAFFIYYKVKLFFDGLTDKFVSLYILEENIVINIYSFVHILFRHYFHSIESEIRSINDPLPFLEIELLPYSVRNFLTNYFDCDKAPLHNSREYLLFSFIKDKYIIWLKYRVLEDLGNNPGFEFRTLYKCIEERDLEKFNGLTEHSVNADLSFYF